MMVHEPSSHDAIQNMNITVEWNKLCKEITKLDGPEVLEMEHEWEIRTGEFRTCDGGV
jgi:metallopeptidase MepB